MLLSYINLLVFIFSDKETSKTDKSPGNAPHSSFNLPTLLPKLFRSCISKSTDDTIINTKELYANPLKKYAPVSVPGWEVNIIYTKNVKKVPRRSYSAGDMESLIDGLDCDSEELMKDNKAGVVKKIILKPIRALISLVRKARGAKRLSVIKGKC